MIIPIIPPYALEWDKMENEKINGERGFLISRKKMQGNITMRVVEYSSNYLADHWCLKGHFVYVIEGTLTIEHSDNTFTTLEKNSSYIIGDDTMPHRAASENGAKVFIVD